MPTCAQHTGRKARPHQSAPWWRLPKCPLVLRRHHPPAHTHLLHRCVLTGSSQRSRGPHSTHSRQQEGSVTLLHCDHGVSHCGRGTDSRLLSRPPLPATVQPASQTHRSLQPGVPQPLRERAWASRAHQAGPRLATSNHYQEALCLTYATVSTHNRLLCAHTSSLALAVARLDTMTPSTYTLVFNSLLNNKNRAPRQLSPSRGQGEFKGKWTMACAQSYSKKALQVMGTQQRKDRASLKGPHSSSGTIVHPRE